MAWCQMAPQSGGMSPSTSVASTVTASVQHPACPAGLLQCCPRRMEPITHLVRRRHEAQPLHVAGPQPLAQLQGLLLPHQRQLALVAAAGQARSYLQQPACCAQRLPHAWPACCHVLKPAATQSLGGASLAMAHSHACCGMLADWRIVRGIRTCRGWL